MRPTALDVIAGEMHAHAREHGFNVLRPTLPDWRDFGWRGKVFRLALSRFVMPEGMNEGPGKEIVPPGKSIYLLSIANLTAVPNERGACMPTVDEAEEIAMAFFPGGCQPMPAHHDILKNSLKYYALV